NRSIFHRAVNLFRGNSAQERGIAIGLSVAATISEETVKRLGKTGLAVTRIPNDSDIAVRGNFLLVTAHLTYVDEGNRLTRVAVGLGLGESYLVTQVHVFRVVDSEKAEVLAFTTQANSGKMPGIAAGSIGTLGMGQLVLGPALIVKAVKDALL